MRMFRRRRNDVLRPMNLSPRRPRRALRWGVWGAAVVFTPFLAMAAYNPAALLAFNNLSDLSSATTARTNLGLGTMATQSASAIAVTGGTLADITGLGMRDTSAAFDVTPGFTSSVALSAARALTIDVVNGARTLKLGSNLTLASDPGAVTGALKSNGSGTFGQAACGDLSNGATGCSTTVGTMATQNANSVAITGGTISGVSISGLAPTWTVTRYTSNTATVTLAHTNYLVEAIAQGTPAALTINLNATTPAAGDIQCVKDEANTFQTNTATVKTTDSSTIDGASGATGFAMNITHQFQCFQFDGNANWMVL